MTTNPLHLFQAFGVELEYMIAGRDSLDVRPLTDRVIHAATGSYQSDADVGPIAWSNELALHVIELKTNGPVATLDGLAPLFQESVRRINAILAPLGARLMPTAMHPWMDPLCEMKLWPHEHNAVYEAFDRIFSVKGHGWANLQSMHVNLPFHGDDEFGRLHAAIRLILPILPALAASSPIMDGRLSGLMDTRLEVYRHNAARVPSCVGRVIPEPLFTRADYEAGILQPIYRDLAPYDPEDTLRHEWVNSRGCIARFERDTIEIRVLDVQECPAADLAICRAVVGVIRALAERGGGRLADQPTQRAWSVAALEPIFLSCVRDADQAVIADAAYLRTLGVASPSPITAGELWRDLVERTGQGGGGGAAGGGASDPLAVILSRGCLARRIVRAVGADPHRERLAEVYTELCRCLDEGIMFGGAA